MAQVVAVKRPDWPPDTPPPVRRLSDIAHQPVLPGRRKYRFASRLMLVGLGLFFLGVTVIDVDVADGVWAGPIAVGLLVWVIVGASLAIKARTPE